MAQAAACELEEEAHLHEGTWHALMKDERTVAAAGKYSTQVFHSYLVVDPVVKGTPRALDDGEFIEYIRGVSLEEASFGRGGEGKGGLVVRRFNRCHRTFREYF